ncbi:MAG TPA: cysteine desulfurase family protein [Candidatus Nanopelagicales bacterium]
MAYLDHAATTPLLPEAAQAVTAELTRTGNPSSLHAAGRRARRVVEESRESIAADLGVAPADVIFTAGGTEADNLAVKGLFWARQAADPRRIRILASAVEHHAVLDPVAWLGEHEGADVTWLAVDRYGRVDVAALRAELAMHHDEVAFVTVMYANNEVGTIQPMPAVAAACAEYEIPLHTDAVQAVGHLEIDGALADTLALSGHKFGGPVGVGALVVRRGVELVPLLHGGGQERELRSGTIDTPAVAGLAAALRVATRVQNAAQLGALRDDLARRVCAVIPGAVLNGDPWNRLPGIAHFSFTGCAGDNLLLLLDAHGVECSTGSACTAGVPRASHVLLAMGVDEDTAKGSLRFSLGHTSTREDVDELLAALPAAVARAARAGQVRAPRRAGLAV